MLTIRTIQSVACVLGRNTPARHGQPIKPFQSNRGGRLFFVQAISAQIERAAITGWADRKSPLTAKSRRGMGARHVASTPDCTPGAIAGSTPAVPTLLYGGWRHNRASRSAAIPYPSTRSGCIPINGPLSDNPLCEVTGKRRWDACGERRPAQPGELCSSGFFRRTPKIAPLGTVRWGRGGASRTSRFVGCTSDTACSPLRRCCYGLHSLMRP